MRSDFGKLPWPNLGQSAKYIFVLMDGMPTLCIVPSDKTITFDMLCKAARCQNIESFQPDTLTPIRPRILVDRSLGETITEAITNGDTVEIKHILFDEFLNELGGEAIEFDDE